MRHTQASRTAQPTTPPPTNPSGIDLSGGGYDEDDRCRACGEHIAEPHAPGCPADADAEE